ncbi:hypothetical protein Tco_0705342 [Tanacetum coccineum]|uniref:Uncharacterized protein n=1 Tax=Tanacetum coccineum TaxID=301880 RepID=A0ABQ4Y574_9ASTR
MNTIKDRSLCALEALWYLLSTVVKQQAQINRHIEVNTQNISFNSCAKTNCGLKVDKVTEEAATRSLCWWIFGGGGQEVELTRVKKTRLRVRRKAVVANALEPAIFKMLLGETSSRYGC